MKKIPENILLIIKAIVPLFIIIVLFFILTNVGFSKISQVQDEISQIKKDQSVLIDKLSLLRTVSATGAEDSDTTLNSLPDNNPSLLVVSQLRNLAAKSGLIVSSVKASADQGGGDLKAVAVNFKIAGEKSVVNSFLLNIKTIAPITVLNKLKISEIDGIYSGEIMVNSFWSPLPTERPTTIEGFQDLTPEDNQMLTLVNSLVQPTFLNLPPADAGGRPNPFAK